MIRAIAEAREHGDLSENAEYHAARERQSFIEGRIAELEDKISRAEVIDVSKLSGTQVKFGATVTLVDEDTDEKANYQIVGPDEADIKTKRLSITSPLGPRPDRQEGRRHRRGHDARRLEVLRDRQGPVQIASRGAARPGFPAISAIPAARHGTRAARARLTLPSWPGLSRPSTSGTCGNGSQDEQASPMK